MPSRKEALRRFILVRIVPMYRQDKKLHKDAGRLHLGPQSGRRAKLVGSRMNCHHYLLHFKKRAPTYRSYLAPIT